LLAALALGAEGVMVGTRLLLTVECPIHTNLKQALIRAAEVDTIPILGSLHNTLRAWKNPTAIKIAEMEAAKAGMWEILPMVAGTETKRMYEEGTVDSGVLACSQAVGIVEEISPVADVIRGMVNEAREIAGRLAGR
jgi:nitronate monooxygenase